MTTDKVTSKQLDRWRRLRDAAMKLSQGAADKSDAEALAILQRSLIVRRLADATYRGGLLR